MSTTSSGMQVDLTFQSRHTRVGYRVEPIQDGFRVVFPPTSQGGGSIVSGLFGLVFILCTVGFARMVVYTGSVGLGWVIIGPVLTLFALVGLVIFGGCVLDAMGLHREIELDRQSLRVIRRAGLIHWTRVFALSDLKDVHLDTERFHRKLEFSGRPIPADWQAQMMRDPILSGREIDLDIRSKTRRPVTVYSGAVQWMMPLAKQLAEQLAVAQSGAVPRAVSPHVAADTPRTLPPVDFAALDLPQPAPGGGGMTLQRRADGVTVTLPPLGWRGSATNRALAKFAAIWLLMMIIVTAGLLGLRNPLEDQGDLAVDDDHRYGGPDRHCVADVE